MLYFNRWSIEVVKLFGGLPNSISKHMLYKYVNIKRLLECDVFKPLPHWLYRDSRVLALSLCSCTGHNQLSQHRQSSCVICIELNLLSPSLRCYLLHNIDKHAPLDWAWALLCHSWTKPASGPEMPGWSRLTHNGFAPVTKKLTGSHVWGAMTTKPLPCQ